MTANIMFLNEWYEGLLDQVEKRDPDVLQIQEMGTDWAKAIDRIVGERYPYRALVPNDDGSGMGIYSKFPIVGEPNNKVALGASMRPQQRVVLELPDGKQVAIYNVHLRSPRNAETVADGRLTFADLRDVLAAEPLRSSWRATAISPTPPRSTTPCYASACARRMNRWGVDAAQRGRAAERS